MYSERNYNGQISEIIINIERYIQSISLDKLKK